LELEVGENNSALTAICQLPSAYFFFGNTASTSACGRAMTWTLTSSPLMALMACAPASVAALTAATSPTTTRRDERVADLRHRADEFDVGGLEHGVRPLDEGDESARFNHSNCLWHCDIIYFG
jgi:hypothetical protein